MKLKSGKSQPPVVSLLNDSFCNLDSEQIWDKKHHMGGGGVRVRVSGLGVHHLATMGMVINKIVP